MDFIGGLMALGKALLLPLAAIASFVWLMVQWDRWGTAKGLAAVLAWMVVFTWLAIP